MTNRNLLFFLAFFLVTTSIACKSNETKTPQSISFHRETPHRPSLPPQPEIEPGIKPLSDSETAQLQNSLSNTCKVDNDCALFLRCLKSKCVFPPAITGDSSAPSVTFQKNSTIKATIFVELAQTPSQRERGLMYRRGMKKNWGMLFIFSQDEPRTFWMKNTYIPLDMLFIDSEGIVVKIIRNAEPFSLSPRESVRPARYVLELYAGMADHYKLAEGDHMTFQKRP